MGDNNALLVQVLAGLVTIFMLVALYFNMKSWKFFHVFMCFLVYAGAVAFAVFGAFVLKTHYKWRTELAAQKGDLGKRQEEAVKFETGDKEEINEIDIEKERTEKFGAGLKRITLELARERKANGRIWRNCLQAASTPNSLVLEMILPANPEYVPIPAEGGAAAAPAPGAPPAPAPGVPPAGAPAPAAPPAAAPAAAAPTAAFVYGFIGKEDGKKLIVQLFQERQISDLPSVPPHKRPHLYIGEFLVDDVTAVNQDVATAGGAPEPRAKLTVSLKPRLPLSDVAKAAMADRDPSFAMYEIMPVDSAEAFAGMNSERMDAHFPSPDSKDPLQIINGRDEPFYLDSRRQFLHDGQTRAQVQKSFEEKLERLRGASDARSLALIAQLEKDRDTDLAWFDALPIERRWTRVKFTKDYAHAVDNKKDAKKNNVAGGLPSARDALIRETDVARLFDANGAALQASLWLNSADTDPVSGEPITAGVVRTGAVAVLEPSVAARLIQEGYCQPDSTDPEDEKDLPPAAPPAGSAPAAPAANPEPGAADKAAGDLAAPAEPGAATPKAKPAAIGAEPPPAAAPARRAKSYEVFVRARRDYRRWFHQVPSQLAEIDTHIAKITPDTARLTTSTKKIESQITFRQDEKTKLEQDKTGYEKELGEIKAYLARLSAKVGKEVERARGLSALNATLSAEFTQLQKRMADEINARSQAISAAPPAK